MKLLVNLTEQNLRYNELFEELIRRGQMGAGDATSTIALDDLSDDELEILANASRINRRLREEAALKAQQDGKRP